MEKESRSGFLRPNKTIKLVGEVEVELFSFPFLYEINRKYLGFTSGPYLLDKRPIIKEE